MGMFCINKSGKAVKVYSDNSFKTQIGTIYANECFAFIERWAGSHVYYPSALDYIRFLSSNGLKTGAVMNDGDGFETSFLNYSFGNVTNSGVTYKSLKTRKALNYYDAAGNRKGTCVSGARVLTNDTTPGQSNPHYMRAMYVETGVNTNRWIAISGKSGTYGFIDSGLGSGSDASKIGIYGNW